MKHLHFLTLVFFAFVGGLFAAAFQMPVFAGAFAGAGMAFMAVQTKTDHQVVRAGLDISAIAGQIDLYFRRFAREISVKLMTGVDFEQYMTPVSGQKGTWTSTSSMRSEFFQPYQKGFTPKGGVTLTPYTNQVYRNKINVLLDNLDELFDTYLAEILVDETRTPDNYPFVKWLFENEIVPGMIEERRIISARGIATPVAVPGTPGDSIDTADGIFTVVAKEITATNIVPIVTGAITSTNIVDAVETFKDGLASASAKDVVKQIFMSGTMFDWYMRKDRELHGKDNDWSGNKAKLYGTNIELVGLTQMNGSKRMIATQPGNMVKLYDQNVLPKLTVQLFNEDVKILGSDHRGYGFKTLDTVFANDQA